MSLRSCLNGLLLALQFFTVIPITGNINADRLALKRSVQIYPVIGIGFGFLVAEFARIMNSIHEIPQLLSALFILTAFVVLTGGLHLDGWMDTSDAYLSYRDLDKRLEIMKDPHIGSFAVLSLLFMLGWRFVLIFVSLSLMSGSQFYLIAFIPFLSRLVMGSVLIYGKPAKPEGLAAHFQTACNRSDLLLYLGIVVVWLCASYHFIFDDLLLLSASLISASFGLRFMNKHFGGMTGDTLGALLEGTETWLWLILWLSHAFVTG